MCYRKILFDELQHCNRKSCPVHDTAVLYNRAGQVINEGYRKQKVGTPHPQLRRGLQFELRFHPAGSVFMSGRRHRNSFASFYLVSTMFIRAALHGTLLLMAYNPTPRIPLLPGMKESPLPSQAVQLTE